MSVTARTSSRGRRAAQYLRMSSEHQTYSLENQAAAIADYARRHGLRLVKSYVDEGISGLHLTRRKGLQKLLADVAGGAKGFEVVLVYDVSRWGRFQNPDQSASYEFLCREAGVAVEYCAETFKNDGSPSSTVLKALKRVMAAEFSRELSTKITASKRLLASKGYWQNGSPGLGLRRQLIDAEGRLGPVLGPGQSKATRGWRAILVAGPREEVELVQRIFRLYVAEGLSGRAIARLLNSEGLKTQRGVSWSNMSVTGILRAERYVGDLVYNRMAVPLRGKPTWRPRSEWRRVHDAWPGIIDRDTFEAAQQMQGNRRGRRRDALLASLARLLKDRGTLTEALIDEDPDLPSMKTVRKLVGSLTQIYAALGQAPERQIYAPRRTDQELLGELAGLLETHGRLSARLVRDTPGMSAYDTYVRRFGSGARAFELANALATHRASHAPRP